MQRQLLRASVRRASPTSASFPPTSMPPDGTARRRSRCRWEEPSTASKACMFLFLMGCLEPTEVVEESRCSSYIQGLQRQRYAYSDHIGFSRARLSIVSRSEPVVVDADCLKLGLHRPHNHHHILDHRHCFHRHP